MNSNRPHSSTLLCQLNMQLPYWYSFFLGKIRLVPKWRKLLLLWLSLWYWEWTRTMISHMTKPWAGQSKSAVIMWFISPIWATTVSESNNIIDWKIASGHPALPRAHDGYLPFSCHATTTGENPVRWPGWLWIMTQFELSRNVPLVHNLVDLI